MGGRALFAAVLLIVAAGLLLPVYAPDGEGPGPAPTAAAMRDADTVLADCRDCAPVDEGETACQVNCPCGHLLTTALHIGGDTRDGVIYLVVQPQPSDRSSRSRPFPPKLPAV
jgi:hypothetical protein